ncbi:FAD dependent oxidoreductase-domain-containing protein [Cladorrhinum samala]|uniref:FAD dependent oxidoreductase-domain-containing protein n=1 Tax=Cladorrhinum samala TaxID=585594 RepID=A0AAV9HMX3_9PEZI|nr:FAD dependent oxidoreductase-domain-containing protein [Cladorrhinum samala]
METRERLIKLDVCLHQNPGHEATPYPQIELSTDDTPHKSPDDESKHILILGAGVSGLMVAWMLLDQGHHVTIFADDWAWTKDFQKSRMTSQIAGALWEFPPGGCGLTEIEAAGEGYATVQHYQEWALQSYEFYHKYYTKISNPHEDRGASLGLRFSKLHQFFHKELDDLSPEEKDKLDAIRATHDPKNIYKANGQNKIKLTTYEDQAALEKEFKDVIEVKGGHGIPEFKSGYTHKAPILNTDKAMAYLMAVVKTKGANLETRKFDKDAIVTEFGAKLLEDYKGDAIVNATGLGAKELAVDGDVYPVRGAVLRVDNTRRGLFRHLNDAYLVPAQKFKSKIPTKTIFIVPRSDDVLYVGSIIQPGNNEKTLTQESPEVEAMWDRAGHFIPRLRHAKLVPEYPFAQGLRPFSKRNAKVRADEEADFPLVHNYGHGGSGWTLGIGTARCAVLLLKRLLGVEDPRGKGGDEEANMKKWRDNVQEAAEKVNEELYGKPPPPKQGPDGEAQKKATTGQDMNVNGAPLTPPSSPARAGAASPKPSAGGDPLSTNSTPPAES